MTFETTVESTETPENASAPPKLRQHSRDQRIPRVVVIVAAIVATFLITRTYSVFNQITDEPVHVATGLEWLDRGTYNYEPLHPPVARVAVALGPFLAGVRNQGIPKKWDEGNAVLESQGQYRRNLTLARLGVLPFLWFACYLLWNFGRTFLTEWHGAIAVILLCFCPPVLAHAAVATTDLPLLAMYLWAMVCGWMLLQRPSNTNAMWAGIAIGLAVVTKFTAIPYLLASFALLIGYSLFRRTISAPKLKHIALACALMAVTIWVVYRCSVGPIVQYSTLDPDQLAQLHGVPKFALKALFFKWVPAHEFFRGLVSLYSINSHGRPSYLLGKTYVGGRWAFFPVAILVKTPVALLILSVLGVIYSQLNERLRANKNILVPIAGIAGPLAIAIPSNLNLGLRHILLIYPFLTILAAVAVLELWKSLGQRRAVLAKRSLVAVLLCWTAISCIRATPDFLAYFNEAAAPYGSRILVDSDLDWGQDLFRLISFAHDEKIEKLWLAYQGSIDLTKHAPLGWPTLPPQAKVSGWIAISEFKLKVEQQEYGWLNRYQPVREVGHSIRIYYIVP